MAPRRANKGRRGQIVVMAPIVIVVLTCMLAITVDVGRIVLERALLQNGCDAAALAGAQVLMRERLDGASEPEARLAARKEAAAIFLSNSEEAAVGIQFGAQADDGPFAVVGASVAATRVRARASRRADAPGGALPLVFAGFFTFRSADVTAAATAEVSDKIVGVSAGLGPFAVPKHRIPDLGEEMTFYPADPDAYDEGNGADKVAPGCWGLLNLDGGALSTTEIIDWVLNGYDEPLELDPEDGYTWVSGTSGFRASLQKPLISIIGEPMIVLVYDELVGGGSNASFRCVGFMLLTITGCKLVGGDPYVTGRVDVVDSLHDLKTGDGNPSINIRKIQLID